MNRFWNSYIGPLIEAIQPRRVLEVGAERGLNTTHILAYCRRNGAHADIVDPAPEPDLHAVLAQFGPAEYRYFALKGTAVIPQLQPPDVALMDGDHNWATVFAELNLLDALADQHDTPPPIILSHDVAWPYARRDMYYDPQSLEASQRRPYAYQGMLPSVPDLVEEGMNGMVANALHEGGPRNGVLTAIEDYIDSVGKEHFVFRRLPFFNGLGMLIPEARMTPAIRATLDGFFSADNLLEACQSIEEQSMHIRAHLQQTEACLGRRTEALHRARELIALQARRIAELEQAQPEQAHASLG